MQRVYRSARLPCLRVGPRLSALRLNGAKRLIIGSCLSRRVSSTLELLQLLRTGTPSSVVHHPQLLTESCSDAALRTKVRLLLSCVCIFLLNLLLGSSSTFRRVLKCFKGFTVIIQMWWRITTIFTLVVGRKRKKCDQFIALLLEKEESRQKWRNPGE